jgi:hypothetical protein
MDDIDKLIQDLDSKKSTITQTEKPKYVNLIDILDTESYLDYSFNNKQFVIIKKSKLMATFDFIIQASLVLIFGILGIGLLFIL